MADMTLKHHKLIVDAIVAGIRATVNSDEFKGAIIDKLDERLTVHEKTVAAVSLVCHIERVMTNEMIAAFCDVLPYTHDKFDKADFGSMVRAELNRGQPI